MKQLYHKYLIIILFIGLILIMKPGNTFAQVPASDSLALVDFYTSTNGPNWINSTNWLTGSVCTWYGIVCGGAGVGEIQLINNNISGTLTESLGNLSQLIDLVLNNNNLTGYIPESLGYLNFINGVILISNHMTGTLPSSFGYAPYLTQVCVDSNDLSGSVPDTILKRTNNFMLSFSDNEFSYLPFNSSFHYWLDCRGNNLTFKDVVPYCLNSNLMLYNYAPQDSILEAMDTTVNIATNIAFSSFIDTCHNNRYRWMMDNVFITPSDTNSLLHIDNVQLSQSGYYSCNVTNVDAPLLTLHRKLIHLHVVDTIDGIPEKNSGNNVQLLYSQTDTKLSILLNLNTIQFVSCNLYDRLGRKVIRLFEGNTRQQELHYYLDQARIKPGIYIVRMQVGREFLSRKVMVE